MLSNLIDNIGDFIMGNLIYPLLIIVIIIFIVVLIIGLILDKK